MAEILTIGSSKHTVKLRRTGSNFTVNIDDELSDGEFSRKSDGRLEIRINGVRTIAYSERKGNEIYVHVNGINYFITKKSARVSSQQSEEESDDVVLSPITGKLLDKKVEDGTKVSKGDVIIILEAMKMEHRLISPRDGVLSKLTSVDIGGQVKEGELMFELEDE
uniref:Carbamoyl-phosphate synthase L chain n=1 Tax=uncultured Poseidoniia archaeon TaxID=1697135 RepID=A0A1B1TFK1_9ARCH|nr:carbamoyl-phosphate synthase L chain [uncultured Candidatus Thalassoarchaea sp.]|tara:strand:- start:75 stop:569 length:495 start_codon:yes stop_codon:yes gene_type:complete